MLGIEAPPRQSYVIDYSAPNLAKEMHIGHLRSTTMGDAAARILDFLGHDVTRANHVGDWGAQFGSLLAYMDQLEQSGEILSTELKDLEVFYKKASALFKSDEELRYVQEHTSFDCKAAMIVVWNCGNNSSLNRSITAKVFMTS